MTARRPPPRKKDAMPPALQDLTRARREEILNACAVLYQTKSFKEITLKEIGAHTSFTRTSIYNYFHTKEEISSRCYSGNTRPGSTICRRCPRPPRRTPLPPRWPIRWKNGR